jgi:thiamine monophosphate kinase
MTNLSNVSGDATTSSAIAISITGHTFYDQGGGVGGNTRAAGDVVLYTTTDGYYMNMYYIDQNNRIIEGYQMDCIQQ